MLFFLIIWFGLLIRLWKINISLLEFYPSRQIQTADISRNFIRNDFNLLKPTVSYSGHGYAPFLIEFPGYNFIVAAIYYFFGINEIYGRLFSLIGWVISVFLLYKIALRFSSRTGGLIAIFFYTLSPLSVLVSRSFQPDQWMLTLSLVSIYLILRWKEDQKIMLFIISLICASLAFLLKTQSVVFTIIPISFAILTSKVNRWKFLFIFYALVSLLPVVLWTVFASIQDRITAGASEVFSPSNYFGWDIFLNPKYYSNIFGFEYNLVLLPIGMMLFILGILTKLSKKQYILYGWLAGIILYFMVFNKLNMTHEYYHLPVLPIASIFIGIAFEKILGGIKNVFIPKGFLLAISSVLLFFLMLPPTLAQAYKPIARFSHVTETATAIKKYTNPNDLIIGSMDGGPSLVYYSERHGWPFEINRENTAASFVFYGFKNPNVKTAQEDLEALRKQGAVIFASADKSQFLSNVDFAGYMYTNYRVLEENDNFIIFDLSLAKN